MVGIGLGRWQTVARNAGKTDPFSQLAQMTVYPGSSAFTGISNAATDFLFGLSSSRSLAEQNRILQSLKIANSQYIERLKYYRSENDQLRKLMNFQPPAGKTQIPAQIISYSPLDNRVTLNKGANEGIKSSLPVVSGEGLVGVVQSVTANSSQVLLISSPQLRVGAVVNRMPKPYGIIRGESTNKMILQITDIKSTVEPGDVVMTSGLGELIPGGIPIGIVSQRTTDVDYGALQCTVFPYVHTGDLREVFVLR